MDYYRPHTTGGVVQSNNIDNSLLNMASDSYASDFWNVPYNDGLSPMKQIEGKIYEICAHTQFQLFKHEYIDRQSLT